METTDPIDLVHQAIRGHATLAEKTGLERLFKRDTGDASGDVQADQIVADVLERAVRHVNGPLESIVVTSAIRAAEHPSAVPLLPCTVPRHMTAADFGPNTVNAYEYHTAKTAYAELPQWAVLQAAIRAAPSELRVKCDDLLRAKARARGALSPEQAGELDIVADRILMLARPLVDARPDTSRGAAISAALEGGQTDVSSVRAQRRAMRSRRAQRRAGGRWCGVEDRCSLWCCSSWHPRRRSGAPAHHQRRAPISARP